jgi:hypothetical protein
MGQDYLKGEIGTPNHNLSWFGRAHLFSNRQVLLTATFRTDGSSKSHVVISGDISPAAAAALENFR